SPPGPIRASRLTQQPKIKTGNLLASGHQGVLTASPKAMPPYSSTVAEPKPLGLTRRLRACAGPAPALQSKSIPDSGSAPIGPRFNPADERVHAPSQASDQEDDGHYLGIGQA